MSISWCLISRTFRTKSASGGVGFISNKKKIEEVKGLLTFSELKKNVNDEEIDTVIVAMVDIYGRLMGKRYTGESFIDQIGETGTGHACSYLLTSDMDMKPIEGFDYANWEQGFGDFRLTPDFNTLRRAVSDCFFNV